MSTTEVQDNLDVQVAQENPTYTNDINETPPNDRLIDYSLKRITSLEKEIEKLQNLVSKSEECRGTEKQFSDNPAKTEEDIQYYIKHRDIDEKVKTESRDPGPVVGFDNLQAEVPSIWLKLTGNVDDVGLNSNSWTISIADPEILNLLKEILKDYIEHTGREKWDSKVVSLSEVRNPIVMYWKKFLEKQSSLPAETNALLRHRFRILLDTHQNICPDLVKLQQFRDTYTTIKFNELDTLIIPGSLVVTNWSHSDSQDVHEAPQVLKVNDVQFGSDCSLIITAWLWDWDGKSLVRNMYNFTIQPFDDNMAILNLPIYPVDFFTHGGKRGIDAIRIHEQYSRREGKKIVFNRRGLFRKYTIGHQRAGPVLRYCGDVIKLQNTGARFAKIDEEIVLDTENYVRRTGSPLLGGHAQALTRICQCSLCEDNTTTAWCTAMEKDGVFQDDDNDLLLAPRVLGYALTGKMWCQFSLDKIATQEFKKNAEHEIYQKFVMPGNMERKELGYIQKLVAQHMNVMAQLPTRHIENTNIGKRDNLILLFHGPSGTGKAFLAESLAKASNMGLFKVDMSDITLLDEAEKMLKEMCELAASWNVILLIDGADALIHQRLRNEYAYIREGLLYRKPPTPINNFKCQAHESPKARLHELDNFKGILIMTTNQNKVTDIEPAILSRVHRTVKFKQLTPAQQTEIRHLSHRNRRTWSVLGK
ncbi:hypothetical protein NHQ30_002621 [Ciborinia camelliae]|nr:hypothetical protein NHQ30_002621 [Ciborinia camelliae]